MTEILTSLLKGLATRLPFLLVCVAGLALVAVRWRRHPKASLLALLGIGLFLLSSLGGLVVYEALPRWAGRQQWNPERVSLLYTATGTLFYVIDALGLGLVLAAVFAERSRRPDGSSGPARAGP